MWKGSGPVGSKSHDWLMEHGNVEAQVLLLPTPQAHDAKGPKTAEQVAAMRADGHGVANLNEVAAHELAPGQLLPTPTASLSGNTPEEHLRKKPGREQVTDLNVLVEYDLLETGGRLLPTPNAALGSGGQTSRSGDRIDEPLLGGLAEAATEGRLLPTPRAQDSDESINTFRARTEALQQNEGRNGGPTGMPLGVAVQRLLPTPRATDGTKGGPNQAGSSGDLMLPSAVQPERLAAAAEGQLLPTPTAGDSRSSGRHTTTTGVMHSGTTLTDAARLLPTPKVAADRTSRGALTKEGHWSAPGLGQAVELADGVLPREYESWEEVQGNQPTSWGPYAAAINRWAAIIGRPPPAPTAPSKKGKPQLSARFVEWMMGLPAGHVTDVPGVSRNDQLKALGNGVVPLQAAAAVRTMMRWRLP